MIGATNFFFFCVCVLLELLKILFHICHKTHRKLWSSRPTFWMSSWSTHWFRLHYLILEFFSHFWMHCSCLWSAIEARCPLLTTASASAVCLKLRFAVAAVFNVEMLAVGKTEPQPWALRAEISVIQFLVRPFKSLGRLLRWKPQNVGRVCLVPFQHLVSFSHQIGIHHCFLSQFVFVATLAIGQGSRQEATFV